MVKKKNPFQRLNTQSHYFCNNGKQIRVNNLLFDVLTETSKKKKCRLPVLGHLIPGNGRISGFIVCS